MSKEKLGRSPRGLLRLHPRFCRPASLRIVHELFWPRSRASSIITTPPTFNSHLSLYADWELHAIMANTLGAIYRWAIPGALAAALIQNSLYDVKGGTRAVIFDRLSGVKEDVSNEGTHFLIPWLQKAIIYDVRTKPRNISTTTGSKDLQMVSLTLRVLHRPEVKMLPKIYQVCSSLRSRLLRQKQAKS